MANRTDVGLVGTLSDVAAAFDVAYRVVKDWPKKDGFPREPDGRYHLVKIAIWRERTFARRKPDPEADETEGLAEARRRKESALAEKHELEVRRIKRELVEADVVDRLFARTIAEHNTLAKQLGDRVLRKLPSQVRGTDRKRIADEVTRAVEDLQQTMAAAAKDWAAEFATTDSEDSDG